MVVDMSVDPKDKDGLALAGASAAPVITAGLIAHGTDANTAGLVGIIVAQIVPTTAVYLMEHGPGRKQREAKRVRQVLDALGQLLTQQSADATQLKGFTDRYPIVVDLMELTVRKAEADTRQNKAQHYARVLRDCLLYPTEVDARALKMDGLIRALSEVNEVDLQLMQQVQELATQKHGFIPVSEQKLLNGVDPQGHYVGGYLRSRVALLVQLGLLHERHEVAYDSLHLKRSEAYHGESLTYSITPYGADFQKFCQDYLSTPTSS